MEINISQFFNEACPKDYSASVAEIGSDAGTITWQAALDNSTDYTMLDDDEKREEFREFIAEFCAWGNAKIMAMSDTELNALLIQFISCDIRESGLDDGVTWEEYNNSDNAGRLYQGDDKQVYYYIGS